MIILKPEIKPEKAINFDSIVSINDFPCISIFVQNNKVWPQNERAQIALKQLIKKVSKHLEKIDLPTLEIKRLVKGIEDTNKDLDFWKSITKNLVFYVSPNYSFVYEVDLNLEDSFHVGHFFDIKPLLPIMHFKPFYLLTLSQENILLYLVNYGNYEKIELEDVPSSFKEFQKFDEEEKTLQSHSYRSLSGKQAIFHGQNKTKDFVKNRLTQFAEKVAKVSSKYINSHKMPVVIVGLPPLSSAFLNYNSTRLADYIEKDPASMSTLELINEARHLKSETYKNEITKNNKKSLSSYEKRTDLEKDLSEVIKIAQEGRVENLFIKKEEYVWGNFSDDSQKVKIFEHRTPSSEDLLNIAALYTLRNGGNVYLFNTSAEPQVKEPAIAFLK